MGGSSSAMLNTTKNESWKLAWKSSCGSSTRMTHAAAARELRRLLGLRSAQPPTMIVIMIVDRIAEDCQPVAPV